MPSFFFLSGWIPAAPGGAGSRLLSFGRSGPWWIFCRSGGGRCWFNNLAGLQHLRVSKSGDVDFSLAGRGGEEREWCHLFFYGLDDGAVRFVLQESRNRFCCTAEVMKQAAKFQRVEETVCFVSSATSSLINRFVNCDFSGAGVHFEKFLAVRHGGEKGGVLPIRACSLLDLRQGRSSASLGSLCIVLYGYLKL